MKKLSLIFILIAIFLSNWMSALIAYNYRDMLCGIEHLGYSAPADIVFLYSIPFGIIITICLVLAYVFYKKSNNKLWCL